MSVNTTTHNPSPDVTQAVFRMSLLTVRKTSIQYATNPAIPYADLKNYI